MTRVVSRAILTALAGAVAGAVGLLAAVVWQPGQVFEMDRDLPSTASGFYPSERSGTETFIWTAPRAQLTLPGLNRDLPWACRVRFRGGRPPDIAKPRVDVQVDGVTLRSVESLDDYQDIEVIAPPRPGSRGLVFGVFSSAGFVPGGGDPRELGVLVDRLECTPAGGGVAWPAPGVVARLAVSGALLGSALSLAGLGAVGATLGAIALAGVQALPFTTGPAQFTSYPDDVVVLALWVGVGLVCLVRTTERVRGGALGSAARFAIVFTGGAVFFKLLGLLHPSKRVVDALYHAHRLEWVLSGRLYFTQIMPDGVEFPYAIALYVFAAPLAWLTTDYVTLLRVVVVVVEAAAGGLLYLAVVRAWQDRLAGALVVVVFHLVPGAYPVLGNANFTNAFGQSAALAAVVAAVVLPLATGRLGSMAIVICLAAVALLSHVSTAAVTLVTLAALAFFYRALGGPALRAPARSVLVSAVVAAVLAVGLYWGHFIDTYRTLARVRAAAAVAAPATPGSSAAALGTATPRHRRFADAIALSAVEIGWPLLILAVVGARRLWAERRCDRLGFALAAWATGYIVFLSVGVLAPVNEGYERYAAEFVSRVDLAVYPAVAILAAAGAAWLWRDRAVWRVATVVLVGAAVLVALRQWTLWLT